MIECTKEALAKLEQLTGKSAIISVAQNEDVQAGIRIATADDLHHIIYYAHSSKDVIDYLIMHECYHVFRIYSVPKTQRLRVYINNVHFNNALKKIPDEIIMVQNAWHRGIVMQLMNTPVDIMIEKAIYEKYHEMRDLQKKTMERLKKEYSDSLSKESQEFTPDIIWIPSNVMNYTFFYYIKKYIGLDCTQPYPLTIRNAAKPLIKITEQQKDSFVGDVDVVNKWAEHFSVSDWFDWKVI